jgi:LysR family transcriptional regulator, hydrogen peroxide-inducible genes activator
MTALPSMKQLRYLVALADEKHFGLAARACFVAQSTLSAGIIELEAQLGTPVAERTNRKVILTPLGEKLAERARLILRETEDMVQLAASEQGPLTGEFHLGVIPTIAPYLLPSVLPKLRDNYPDLKLFIREEQTDRLLEKLGAGAIDAAILALPYPMDGVATALLGKDRFLLACSAGHRLAEKSSVSTAELANEPLLLLEDGHCLREHALAACDLAGREKNQGFEATSLQTLTQMVAGGLGLTLLPQMAIDAGIARGLDIAIVPLDHQSADREIGICWRKTSTRTAEIKILESVFKAPFQ